MVFGRHFSRGKKAREALLRSLIRALIVSGKLTTTKAKAKGISGQVDKLVAFAKENSVSAKREVLGYLGNDRKSADILFSKIAPVFGTRKSGFTRIILLPRRLGDRAEMARMEWVEKIEEKVPVKKVAK